MNAKVNNFYTTCKITYSLLLSYRYIYFCELCSNIRPNMALDTKYNSKQIENKWYNYWIENRYFHSEVDGRTPYTIVIPPPNVTGVLHMGHMLNNTIQDVLIRKARLQGFNACWVPGTDHASIATEAKVVAKLKSEGIDKATHSREEFLEHAWAWTHKHGGIILEQLKKLGLHVTGNVPSLLWILRCQPL